KSGAPAAPVIAGNGNVTATVYATDSLFNQVATTATVNLTSDDSNGTPSATPLAQPLVGGTTVFTVTLLTAQDPSANAITHHLTINSGGLIGYQTPNFLMAANTPTRLQLLMPGESPL